MELADCPCTVLGPRFLVCWSCTSRLLVRPTWLCCVSHELRVAAITSRGDHETANLCPAGGPLPPDPRPGRPRPRSVGTGGVWLV